MKTRNMIPLMLLALAVTLVAVPAVADEYTIDGVHSSVGFEVRHLAISKVRGTFSEFEGQINFVADKPAEWSVEAVVQATSIDTANEDRDKHLRSEDFFEVEKYPTLEFKSTAVEMENGTDGILRGELTLHGVTQVVEMDLEYLGSATDPWGNDKVGFSATTMINRKDFGLTWSKTLETGGLVVGDEVKISLDIEGTKVK